MIALSRIGRIVILSDLFKRVIVPRAVLDELRLAESRPGVESLAEAVAKKTWLRCRTPSDERPIPGLDSGESAAIRLAEQLSCPLLVDERRARNAARKRNICVIGTGRLLVAAKEHDLIENVSSVLDQLRIAGYRMSDPLIQRLLVLAREAPEE